MFRVVGSSGQVELWIPLSDGAHIFLLAKLAAERLQHSIPIIALGEAGHIFFLFSKTPHVSFGLRNHFFALRLSPPLAVFCKMSDPEKYTVGCICALTTEFVAMQSFLDKRHDPPVAVAQEDYNNYALGTIGNHNVVVAVLPRGEYGLVNATSVAKDILHTFPNIRFGLMVGIGGGAPGPYHDIRLGDVVVSSPENGRTGVLQYDFGKTIQNKKFLQTGTLNKPPKVLLTALAGLEASYESDGHQLEEEIDKVLQKRVRLQKKYSRPPTNSDKLYRPDFIHHISEAECQDACGEDPSTLVSRHRRDPQAGEDDLTVHYGLIASANTLMKDAQIRDLLRTENDVLCFEMEAAGLMDSFPCLVIRGICDYSDSHKNKKWQGYAAMAAAAYAKDLLNQIPQNKVERERRANEVLSDSKWPDL